MRRFLLALAMVFAPLSAQALPVDGEWEEFGEHLQTVLPTEAELGSAWWSEIRGQQAGAALAVWTGALFDPDRREIVLLRPGGHADYGGADSFCVNIDTGIWTRCEPTQHLTNTTEPGYNATACPWPTNGAPAQHTYDGVEYLAPNLYLHTGTPGFCKSTYMSPKSTAFVVDRSTTPWTWIRRDDLKTYIRSMTARYGSTIVLHGSSGSALLDTAGNVLSTASIRGVVMNGATMPVAGYTSLFSAGGLSSTGFFCASTGNIWLHCTNVNGGIRDIDGNGTLDNDTFGRFRRIPIGAGVGANPIAAQLFGYHSMAAMPDGWFALWNGGKKLIFFRPSPTNNPAADPDQWAIVEPATGPTDGTNTLTYDKIFWDEQTCTLVGVSNRDQGLWRFNPDFVADCLPGGGGEEPPPPPPPPPAGAALDTGPWGPDPDASLASLALRSDTLLADPLDDTLIQGPGVKPTDICRTMTEASNKWVCNPYQWRSNYLDRDDDPSVQAQLDKTMKVEGDGSLQFLQESESGSTGGKYEVNPSADGSVGVSVGGWVRVRYKVRYQCEYLFLDCDPNSPTYKTERRKFKVTEGAGGFKMGQLGEVFRPNGSGGSTFVLNDGLHTPVFAHYKQLGYPGAYIWGWNRLIAQRWPKIQGVTNFDIQPGGPTTCLLYDPTKTRVLTPWLDPGCFMYQADEWMTFQEDIYYGPCTSISVSTLRSRLRLWAAHEGEPFQLVMDTPIDIGCATLKEPGPKLGRFGFTTFMTGKDGTEVHPEVSAWLDNVWISRIDEPAPEQ